MCSTRTTPQPPPTAAACRLGAFRLAFVPLGGLRLGALGTALGAFGGGATFARQRRLLCGGGGRAGGGGGGAAEDSALGGGPSGSSDLSFLKASSASGIGFLSGCSNRDSLRKAWRTTSAAAFAGRRSAVQMSPA